MSVQDRRPPRYAIDRATESTIDGPFGKSSLVLTVPVADIAAIYRMKCRADVTPWFHGLEEIGLFECQRTGYRFWRPESIAGDEAFYRYLAGLWPDYYRSERWEYPLVRDRLRETDRLLEVGCGRGFFLRSIEDRIKTALGLEFNAEAIDGKVTRVDIANMPVDRLARAQAGRFDVVCSFQVLEHVVNPHAFLAACFNCLRPGGLLILSTPNHESAMLANREDAFDLPPHHMGYFSAAVYRRVAELFGARIESIQVEDKYFDLRDAVTAATRRSFAYRLARRVSTIAMTLAYRSRNEPGNNILVFMRKA
jgi:SAM-dependent methyltransferase